MLLEAVSQKACAGPSSTIVIGFQELYNKLMELLGHVWDFITVQAEMQLKLHKEKKKSDRVVLDSQERAFWRAHKPPVQYFAIQNLTKPYRLYVSEWSKQSL